MKNFRYAEIIVLLLIIGGCDDLSLTRNPSTRIGNVPADGERPGTFTDHPNGDRYPYPDIIFREFIPRDDLYDWKTFAWRITWPEYGAGADKDRIPTLFSLNGALHSFYYLNNVDPTTTYQTVFSLYDDGKLTRPSNLSTEVDFIEAAPKGSMKEAWFSYDESGLPPDFIQWMVEQAPSAFQWNYYENMTDDLPYDTGHFIYFKLEQDGEPTRYGGIRIVSMTPRIIEVYLAVPL